MLWSNPRCVFFREEPLPDPSVGPRGAQGVPLTPGRSIAVDPQSVPYGTPVWLDTTEPLSTHAAAPPGDGAGHRQRHHRRGARRLLLGLGRRRRGAGRAHEAAAAAVGAVAEGGRSRTLELRQADPHLQAALPRRGRGAEAAARGHRGYCRPCSRATSTHSPSGTCTVVQRVGLRRQRLRRSSASPGRRSARRSRASPAHRRRASAASTSMPLTSSTHWLRTAAPGPQGVHQTRCRRTCRPCARRSVARAAVAAPARAASRPCAWRELPACARVTEPPASRRGCRGCRSSRCPAASRCASAWSSLTRISTLRLRCGGAACASPTHSSAASQRTALRSCADAGTARPAR